MDVGAHRQVTGHQRRRKHGFAGTARFGYSEDRRRCSQEGPPRAPVRSAAADASWRAGSRGPPPTHRSASARGRRVRGGVPGPGLAFAILVTGACSASKGSRVEASHSLDASGVRLLALGEPVHGAQTSSDAWAALLKMLAEEGTVHAVLFEGAYRSYPCRRLNELVASEPPGRLGSDPLWRQLIALRADGHLSDVGCAEPGRSAESFWRRDPSITGDIGALPAEALWTGSGTGSVVAPLRVPRAGFRQANLSLHSVGFAGTAWLSCGVGDAGGDVSEADFVQRRATMALSEVQDLKLDLDRLGGRAGPGWCVLSGRATEHSRGRRDLEISLTNSRGESLVDGWSYLYGPAEVVVDSPAEQVVAFPELRPRHYRKAAAAMRRSLADWPEQTVLEACSYVASLAFRGRSYRHNARDTFMAEIPLCYLRRFPDRRVVMLAHNGHIQSWATLGDVRAGRVLRRRLRASYLAVQGFIGPGSVRLFEDVTGSEVEGGMGEWVSTHVQHEQASVESFLSDVLPNAHCPTVIRFWNVPPETTYAAGNMHTSWVDHLPPGQRVGWWCPSMAPVGREGETYEYPAIPFRRVPFVRPHHGLQTP